MIRNVASALSGLVFAFVVGTASASNLPCTEITIPPMEQYPFHPGDWVSKVCRFAKANNLLAKGIDTVDQCIDATRCTMYPDATPEDWVKLSATRFRDDREYPIAVDGDAVDAFFSVPSDTPPPSAAVTDSDGGDQARMALLEGRIAALERKRPAGIDPSVQTRLLALEAFKVATEKRLARHTLLLTVLQGAFCRKFPDSDECHTSVNEPDS